ncbi:MAG TPA: ADOP family duplicated permease [Gemmatimonadales bacterium]|nr:ADOP family duplicated permease [Gemmatimonadales bacterium]
MSGLFHDIWRGIRRLSQAPVFSAVVIATLALGIGVNVALFTVADRALLRAVPASEPERLVRVWQTSRLNQIRLSLSYQQIRELAGLGSQVEAAAGYETGRFNVSGNGDPVEVPGLVASADLFRVLKISPRLGRAFAPSEEHDQVVLLSYRWWVTRWGADPEVLGKALTIENRSYTIIGVLPPEATFPSDTEQLWLPIGVRFAADPTLETDRRRSRFSAVLRLAPGATLGSLRSALTAAAASASGTGDTATARFETGYAADLLTDEVSSTSRPVLLVLLGAALLVLVAASANAAALLIARATGRQREIALRQVLGAGPGRVLRELLLEHLLLALAAGVVGGLLAEWGLALLAGTWPAALPRVSLSDAPFRVLLFTALISLVTGVAFGLVPAMRAVNPDLERSLRADGTRTSGSRQRRRLLNGLVAGQLAVSLVLLVGAGLLLRSFIRLGAVDPGFDPAHLLAMRVRLTPSRYPGRPSQDAFYDALVSRLQALPGVDQVTTSTGLPLAGSNDYNIIDPREIRPDDPESMLMVGMFRVGDDFPAALRMPLIEGRGLTREDNRSSSRSVVISRGLALRLWGDQPAVGKRIPQGTEPLTVVGVAQDLRFGRLDGEVQPAMYLPLRQESAERGELWFLIRFSGDPIPLAAGVKQAVRSVDRDQPIGELVSMMDVVSRSTASRRFNLLLVSVFAGLALGLAVIGIAGVTAYSLSQRTRELGIRVALGADRATLLKLGLGEVVRVVAVGAGVGLLLALLLTRALGSMLFGVGPSDPLSYLAGTMVVAGVALVACYVPIHRAAGADPIITLKAE